MKRPHRLSRSHRLGTLTLMIGFVASMLLATTAQAGRKAPETSEAQLSFGVEMAKRGLWSEALFRFKQADRRSPGNSKILNNMAVAYEALGNFEKALDYYQDAIKSDPTNKELKRNYSRFVEFYRAFKPAEDAEATATAPRRVATASDS
ncbi:MAG: tetratricopeptide repeat protein [Acidobacteriota bacterium]